MQDLDRRHVHQCGQSGIFDNANCETVACVSPTVATHPAWPPSSVTSPMLVRLGAGRPVPPTHRRRARRRRHPPRKQARPHDRAGCRPHDGHSRLCRAPRRWSRYAVARRNPARRSPFPPARIAAAPAPPSIPPAGPRRPRSHLVLPPARRAEWPGAVRRGGRELPAYLAGAIFTLGVPREAVPTHRPPRTAERRRGPRDQWCRGRRHPPGGPFLSAGDRRS